MARPTTKDDLIDQAQAGYDAIEAFIEALPAELQHAEFAFEDRDRCLRDVIAHLGAWQKMMERWYADAVAGAQPAIPAPGYTWRTTPQLNQAIWTKAQQVDLDAARADLAASHARLLAIIASHTDAELFTAKRYAWTGSTSLGAYLISATSSHYGWAMKKLRRAKRTWA